MDTYQQRQNVEQFVKAALECSFFIDPKAPGLTHEELIEIGQRAGLKQGEISDALRTATAPIEWEAARLLPRSMGLLDSFRRGEEPDYRNPAAFDFVRNQLVEVARERGAANARLERGVIVERARANNIPAHDAEVAISILVHAEQLEEENGIVRFRSGANFMPALEEIRRRQPGEGKYEQKHRAGLPACSRRRATTR